MMVNAITGFIGFVLVAAFLGLYAVKLNALPLWIIIGAILLMVLTDYVISFKEKRDEQ